jgi:RNA polymerase sigma factor (sigma-70 family)
MPPSPHQPADNREPIEVRGPLSSDAFGELIRRLRLEAYAAAVARSIVRNTEDVCDVVQECMFAFYRALQVGEQIANVMAFIAATARNKAHDIRRRADRLRFADSSSLSDIPQPDHSPEDHLLIRDLVETALRSMEEKMRPVLVAVLIEGKNCRDAAKDCGCKIGTVYRWIRQLIEKIKRLAK